MTEDREALSVDYDAWHAHRLSEEGDSSLEVANFACWHQMVIPRLGRLEGVRVAEIGCGRGNFALYLARQGADVTAMDFSAAAIEIARERSTREQVPVNWLVGDAAAIPLPTAEFDLVISCECMEHVPQYRQMMAELARICRPGGRLLLTTPSNLNAQLLAWFDAWLRRKPYNSGSGVQPHENLFFTWTIQSLLRRNGWRCVFRDARIFRWLLLPRVNPHWLHTEQISSPVLKTLARPFGLHQLYEAVRDLGACPTEFVKE